MYKFNNNNIFTGHLKQRLSSFNLPKFRIYTKDNARYKIANGAESSEIVASTDKHNIYYLRNNEVQLFKDNKWIDGKIHYHPDIKILNYTKTLNVKNNIYDSYTHEYLGEYLRFLRDHDGLDLMPMYNCFSNKICNSLKLSITPANTTESLSISTKESNYKIYMLPVKLFKKYTIAIDCDETIELFCCIYHQRLAESSLNNYLPGKTYRRYSSMLFNRPFVYDLLNYENISSLDLQSLALHEADLKLFIKLPKDNVSTITILEGDYTEYNNGLTAPSNTGPLNKQLNKSIINLEYINTDPDRYGGLSDKPEVNLNFKPISKLQLLEMDTGESYPFADRLIEYLSDNVVTGMDEISDNIRRAQLVMSKNTDGRTHYTFDIDGVWEPKMQVLAYSAMVTDNIQNDRLYYSDKLFTDCLGYIDKDVEMTYSYKVPNKKYKVSIGQANLYENIYKDQAKQIDETKEREK